MVVKYINKNGNKINISNGPPYFFKDIDISTNVNVYNSKGANQDGSSYLGNALQPADISLKFTLVGESGFDIDRMRKKVLAVFNPKPGQGELFYKGKKIETITNKLPYFSPLSDKATTCIVSLTANDPYWQGLKENKEEIATWQPSFSFPLSIPEEGIEMGYREPSLIVNVFNNGDVETGMKMIFRALGTLENPELFNVNTREFFKINTTMQPGDVITVTTHQFNKRIELERNGVVSNYFNWMDWQSTFLQLAPGDNLFRYDAKSGLDNLEVDIYHTSKSLGV